MRAGAGLRNWRLIGCVFLPFVLGYYLSYVFRTITTAVSGPLMSEFGFDAASMGLLASVYFLSFAAVQIPIGVLLDRYGPRRVQAVLLVLAGGGATLFGTAAGYTDLVVARVLIGVGVAGALMAGLKAIVMWFPKERVAFINGWMIMLGTLGAATATVPADWLLGWTGWRGLFEMLTLVTFGAAGAVYFIVPERAPGPAKPNAGLSLRAVYSDKRFWRIAPLSATCIGSSWAFQSLWAAPWLRDVEGFGQSRITGLMFVMALGVSIGALFLGTMADRLRKRGINAETLLAIVAGLFVFAELALIFQLPIPPTFSWLVISTVGAATVLSYATIRDYFPAGLAARANGALNLVHFGWAFVAQYGIGLLISLWPPTDGRYPAAAYHLAFGVCVTFQAGALVWFALPWLRVWSIGLCDLLFYDRGDEDSLAFVNCPGEYVTLVGEGGEW